MARPLFRPRTNHTCHQKPISSRETVCLSQETENRLVCQSSTPSLSYFLSLLHVIIYYRYIRCLYLSLVPSILPPPHIHWLSLQISFIALCRSPSLLSFPQSSVYPIQTFSSFPIITDGPQPSFPLSHSCWASLLPPSPPLPPISLTLTFVDSAVGTPALVLP
jgi:hypothetical protein